MSFFASEIVQDEIQTLASLKTLRDSMITISSPNLTIEEVNERIELIQESLDKIKVFYTRLSLSDDKDTLEIKQKLYALAILLGKNNIMEVFNEVQEMINNIRDKVNLNNDYS